MTDTRPKISLLYLSCKFEEFYLKRKYIPGDNIQTALSVARECGIVNHGDRIYDVNIIPADKTRGARVEFHETGITQTVRNFYERKKMFCENICFLFFFCR